MKIISFFIITLLSLPVSGWAQSLIEEPFDYAADGTSGLGLQSAGVWGNKNTGDSILVTAGSLSYAGLATPTGNKVSFGGEPSDYYRTFTGQDAGTVYVSFAFRVTALPSATTGDYFIFLGNNTAVAAPVYLRASATSGKFNIGLAKRNNISPTWMDADLDVNTTYYLVFAITYVDGTKNDVCELWLNPAAGGKPVAGITITSGADITVFKNMNRVIIDHSASGNDGLKIDLDELRVTTTWPALSAVSVPAAPSALSAMTASSSAVNLSWTDNASDETGFRVERSADDVSFDTIATVAADVTTYADKGLSAATTYYYRVLATGASANSDYSDTAQVTTSAAAPAAPSALTATAASFSSIGLSWTDNASDETGFQVERSTDEISFDTVATLAANTTTYADNGLSAATTYYYRVLATGASVNSGYADTARATTGTAAPAAPSGLSATAASSSAVNLSWTDNANDETGFHVERSADDASFVAVATVTADATTYADKGLSAATTYYYRVLATGASANSDYSDTAQATTPAAAPAGTLIEEPFDYAADGTSGLGLQSAGVWGNKNTGDSILVTAGSLSYAGLATPTGNKISFGAEPSDYYRIFAGQDAGTVYVSFAFRVTALPSATTGDYFIFLGNNTAVAAPVYLRASATAGKFNIGLAKRNNISPTWMDADLDVNTTYYLVFAITYVDGTKNDVCELWLNPAAGGKPAAGITITSGADITVFKNMNRVIIDHSASGNDGLKIDLDELRVTTTWPALSAVSVPAAPSALSATAASSSSVNLSWADNASDETGFQVERSADDVSFDTIATVAADVTTYVDKGLSAATTYYYRVLATGASANSAYSDTAEATTKGTATLPQSPSALSAMTASSSAVNLSWTDNASDETGFQLERSVNNISFDTLATVPAGATTYTDNGLNAGATYYYRLLATGAAGNSGYSDTAQATTMPLPEGMLIQDPFGYPADPAADLATQSAGVWSSTGGGDGALVTQGSLSYPGLAASGGNKIAFDGSSSGYFRSFAGQTAGTIYTSFIFTVTRLPDSPTGDYFVYMGNASAVTAPVYLKKSSTPGKFNIGLAKRNNLTPAWLDKDLDLNTPYYLVFAITYVDGAKNDICSLWLDPSAGAEPAADLTTAAGADMNNFQNLNRIILSHSADGNAGLQMELDELRVTDQWLSLAKVVLPGAPTALTARTASSTSVNLSWKDNSDNETGFDIERSIDNVSFDLITTVAAGGDSYTDKGLTTGTTFYYRVRAQGADGGSGYSDTASATPSVSVPATPSGLQAVANTSSAVTLSWTDNAANETGFRIERSTDGTTFVSISTVAAGNVSYKDGTVDALTTYYYRILATGVDGNSGYSDTAEVKTPAHIPDAPSALTAIPDSTGAVVLHWTESSGDETGFELQRSADSVNFTTVATPDAGTLSFRDSVLKSSTRYYYRILATGENGNSPYSAVVTAITVATVPAAPGPLTATALTAHAVQLQWTDNSDNETWFEIERSTDGSSFMLAATCPPGSDGYSDGDLEASTTYYYRVRATGLAGSSAYSDTASATTEVQPHDRVTAGNVLTPNGDGRNDLWVIGNIGQYPDNEVTVFDRAGRVVFRQKSYDNTWNGTWKGSPLSSGAYIYVIEPGPGFAPVKGVLTIIHDR